MTKFSKLELKVKDLFKSTYTSNCKLEDIITTSEQIDLLLSVDVFIVLENLSLLVDSLILFKQNSLQEEKSSLIQQNEQLESLLQKLEAEVRNHIRVEQELKLQNEEAENEKNQYLNEIKMLTFQIKTQSRTRKNSSDFSDKIEQLESSLAIKNNIIHKLELDFVKLRSMIITSSPIRKKKRNGRGSQEKQEKQEKQENLNLVRIDPRVAEGGRSPAMKGPRTKSARRVYSYYS
jgi:hypothetical protein